MRITDRTNATGWGRRLWPVFFMALLPFFTSCSETEGSEDEYADWKTRNEAYFQQIYQRAQAGGSQWRIIHAYSKAEGATAQADNIVVEVLRQGEGTLSPYLSDSVSIHYRGRIMPSVSYPSGYEFETTFKGDFDPDISVPTKTLCNGFVTGFATALLHMHRGDFWRVYMPYQLGYGETAKTGIPAYSTLVFEIGLADFWMSEQGDRKD